MASELDSFQKQMEDMEREYGYSAKQTTGNVGYDDDYKPVKSSDFPKDDKKEVVVSDSSVDDKDAKKDTKALNPKSMMQKLTPKVLAISAGASGVIFVLLLKTQRKLFYTKVEGAEDEKEKFNARNGIIAFVVPFVGITAVQVYMASR